MPNDLWYPVAVGEERRWHLAVEMAAEGLRTMRTACGMDAIALGEGVPFGKVPNAERCWSCAMRHGKQLADRRETEQPARIAALADLLAAGLDTALEREPQRRQIEGG